MIQKIIWTFCVFLLTFLVFYTTQQTASASVVEQTEVPKNNSVDLKHLKCLATGIYYESKGEPDVGQIAVARVIINRVLHGFADDPCAVIYQTSTKVNGSGRKIKLCQFTWVCDGKTTPSDSNPAFQKAKLIARQVLEDDKWADIIPNNILFFHSKNSSPNWPYKKVKVIGNHIFYSYGREKTHRLSY